MLHKMKLPALNTYRLEYTENFVDLESFGKCPICGKEISPRFLYAHFSSNEDSLDLFETIKDSQVSSLYECPSCHNGILVTYRVDFNEEYSQQYKKHVITKWKTFKIKSISPPAKAIFPYKDIISTVSPRFKSIYMQSLQAKLDGKDELVGIGYRKGIEFLIKDYLIYKEHEKSDKIPNMHLGDCINLIDSERIKTLARASIWLGNDETHYVRKHTDKDIQDLEKFINALVYYLTYELTVDEATSFIGK